MKYTTQNASFTMSIILGLGRCCLALMQLMIIEITYLRAVRSQSWRRRSGLRILPSKPIGAILGSVIEHLSSRSDPEVERHFSPDYLHPAFSNSVTLVLCLLTVRTHPTQTKRKPLAPKLPAAHSSNPKRVLPPASSSAMARE